MSSRVLVSLVRSPMAQLTPHHAARLSTMSGAALAFLYFIDELKHINGFERPHIYLQRVYQYCLSAIQALPHKAAFEPSQSVVPEQTARIAPVRVKSAKPTFGTRRRPVFARYHRTLAFGDQRAVPFYGIGTIGGRL